MLPYTLTNNSVTLVIDNKVHTVTRGQKHWESVLSAIREDDVDELIKVVSIASSITRYTEGNVSVIDNQVFYKGVALDSYVVDKVLEFSLNKLPLTPILRFIDNLMNNPSRRAINELYTFLQNKQMPLTPDGNFLAYKGVSDNFYSITAGKLTLLKGSQDESGHIYNGVGQEVETLRNQVCDDASIGCSTGIHAGSLTYATDFAGRNGKVVIVEINPKDVVSVPTDCSCQKLRTCAYKVVGIFEVPLDTNYNNKYGTEDWQVGNDGDGDGGEFGVSDDEYPDDYDDDDYDDGLADGEDDKADGLSPRYTTESLDHSPNSDSDEYIAGYVEGYGEVHNQVDYDNGLRDGESDDFDTWDPIYDKSDVEYEDGHFPHSKSYVKGYVSGYKSDRKKF